MKKSFLMFGIAIAVASGGRALGRIVVTQGDALYLGLEDSAKRLQDRGRNQLAGAPPPKRLAIARVWPRGADGVAAIECWLDDHKQGRLVVIDTLAKFRARVRRERSYDTDYSDLEPLQQLAIRKQVAIVVIHHTRKLDATDWIDQISGTLGLAGAADCLLGVFGKRGELQAELKTTGRDIEERELGLRFDPETCNWCLLGLAATTVGLSQERSQVLDLLSHLSKPAKAKDMAERLGKPYHTIRKLLQRMAADGLVISTGLGYAPHAACLSHQSHLSDGTTATHATYGTHETQKT
jgi:RecA-family ATPase